jgi:hypothetical protein
MLELLLRPPTCFLMVAAGRWAERPQPGRRQNLISATVWHDYRDRKRPRIERRDRSLLRQLLKAKRRCRQDVLQQAAQLGDLGLEFAAPGCGIGLPAVLVRASGLALIAGVGSNRGALRSFLFLLRSSPGSLLRITLALLTTLSFGPRS